MMNRKEKQEYEIWLIDKIVNDCLKNSRLNWQDHPRSQELKDLQDELYPEEETEEDTLGDIVPSWMYEEYREKG